MTSEGSQVIVPVVAGQGIEPAQSAGQESTSAAPAPVVNGDGEHLARLERQVGEIRTLFEERMAFHEQLERALRQCEQANQSLSAEQRFREERPLLLDLIRFYDNLARFRDQITAAQPPTTAEIRRGADNLVKELLEALSRRDVERIEDAGDRLDRQLHQVLARVPAEKPEEDLTIAEVVHAGFRRWGGKILRPVGVRVRRFQGGTVAPAAAAKPAS